MPLINCKIKLKLKWEKYCFVNYRNIVFTIKDIKLYVPIVTLSAKDNHKLLRTTKKTFQDEELPCELIITTRQ